MSTRATYSIEGTTLYLHYDGYPTGAALRFVNMIEAATVPQTDERRIDAIEDRRGGWLHAFIRGNLDAEPAYQNSHEGHGDTQWRYDLAMDGKGVLGIQVTKRVNWETDEWALVYSGDLLVWLDAMRKDDDSLEPCVMVSDPYGVTYATAKHAAAIAARSAALALRYDENNPNRAYQLTSAGKWGEAARSVAA